MEAKGVRLQNKPTDRPRRENKTTRGEGRNFRKKSHHRTAQKGVSESTFLGMGY